LDVFFYRQRSKDCEIATYFTILGDEIAAKKALARAAEISNEQDARSALTSGWWIGHLVNMQKSCKSR
jgi:hypothetical protein